MGLVLKSIFFQGPLRSPPPTPVPRFFPPRVCRVHGTVCGTLTLLPELISTKPSAEGVLPSLVRKEEQGVGNYRPTIVRLESVEPGSSLAHWCRL